MLPCVGRGLTAGDDNKDKMKTFIKSGYGFTVGQDFARAAVDTPIELDAKAYAQPGCVVGYIPANPNASLGFLKYGTNGKVRVHVQEKALALATA